MMVVTGSCDAPAPGNLHAVLDGCSALVIATGETTPVVMIDRGDAGSVPACTPVFYFNLRPWSVIFKDYISADWSF